MFLFGYVLHNRISTYKVKPLTDQWRVEMQLFEYMIMSMIRIQHNHDLTTVPHDGFDPT